MSLRYKGGVISATPPTTSTTSASGNWTLEQQMQAQGAGTWPFGGPFVYIEDVFSTYLYTGTGANQSINNGIDLSTYGGLVWIKNRTTSVDNALFDTLRGANYQLVSNKTQLSASFANSLTAFNSNGFSLGIDTAGGCVNFDVGNNYTSWTFRKQAKFFDVVTYTGDGTSPRQISHNLGSTPGFIVVKRTDTGGTNWTCYHQGLPNPAQRIYLNSTSASQLGNYWDVGTINATTFCVWSGSEVNASGGTYVAYLFAHNAGGFGLTGTDNVITCGSFTAPSSGSTTVTLGYEPQWVLFKDATSATNWYLVDSMRGMTADGYNVRLFPNLSSNDSPVSGLLSPTATGFTFPSGFFSGGDNIIYIAIRRGPMKTPTSGTSVFTPIARTGTGAAATVSGVGFPPDLVMPIGRNTAGYGDNPIDRLRGNSVFLKTYSTSAEVTDTAALTAWTMDGFTVGASGTTNDSGVTYVYENFRRAPGFFDEVCYTGNNVYQQAQTHNLGVAPELIIVKRRDSTANWAVGCNFTNTEFQYLNLNSGADGGNTNAYTTGGFFGGKPTATTFILAQNATTNASGGTYVAYLFATLAGVSKVGTYTGTGAAQTINCGFTGGARFVLIKRLGDNVDPGIGDWYVYDSARGITSGNDPYLFMNSAAAEVTGTNYVDTDTTGFKVTAAAPAGLNASGGTYIFLAIA